MSKRSGLDRPFNDRLSQKPTAARPAPPPADPSPAIPQAEPEPAEDAPAESSTPTKVKRAARASAKKPVRSKAENEERVQILVRIEPAIRKRLKMIAVEQERTIQEICEQAIRDIVKRNAR